MASPLDVPDGQIATVRLFQLPFHHAHAFDRQIIAQALPETIPVVTGLQRNQSCGGPVGILGQHYNGAQKETSMAITIRPEHERLIVQAIQTGGQYFSPEQSRLEMERRKAEWTREHRA